MEWTLPTAPLASIRIYSGALMPRLATAPAEPVLPATVHPPYAPETRTFRGQQSVELPERKTANIPREPRLWLEVFAVCFGLGLIEFAQTYWFYHPEQGRLSFARALGLGLGLWCSWAVLWLIAWPMALRFPLGHKPWRGRLLLHLAVSFGCVLLKMLLDFPVIKYCYCPTPDKLTFAAFLYLAITGYTVRYMLIYWGMIGVSHAVDYYDKYRDGLLETGLAHARLQLLKTQLQPQFLFNTLNAISALVHVDVEAADRTLVRLGDLLRLALEDFTAQEAPLVRELEIARSYLEIEQARLGPRLTVEWNIAPDSCDALVPTFLLQPLIENAIHHGIAPRIGPGRVEIRAERLGSELHLEVRDDGLGLHSPAGSGGGAGLANTRARLLHLYGTAQRLELSNVPQGGCMAKIVLPYHEEDGEASDLNKGPAS
jgi:hypothetical protein